MKSSFLGDGVGLMAILASAAMEKMLKKAGAGRISEDAKAAMRDALEEYGAQIAAKAIKFSKHSGRKTIKAEDVQLARKIED